MNYAGIFIKCQKQVGAPSIENREGGEEEGGERWERGRVGERDREEGREGERLESNFKGHIL